MAARISSLLLFIAASLFAVVSVHATETSKGEERWLDINGCRLLNAGQGSPPSQTKVNWTGQCHDGALSGEGELTIEIPGSPQPMKYAGQFANGRIERGRWEFMGAAYEGEFNDNLPGGQGQMTFPNGDRVTGRFTKNAVAAEGVYEVSFGNGTRYEGALDTQMRMHGKGTLHYADGSTYEGEFREDRLEGRGTLRRASGDIESGTFIAGYLSGPGTKTWANGSVYEGAFVADSPQGQGVMRFADGSRYSGGFVSGKYSGKGRLEYAAGGECEAEFLSGQLHGQGKCSYANGDRYEGSFLADRMTGEGVFTFATGEVREGRFLNGRLTGHCHIHKPTGYRFEGQCIEGAAEGPGHLEEPQSKVVYDGNFRQNLPHGEGTMTRGPSTYKGMFRDGKRDGHGTETVRDDKMQITYEGEFSNDRWHGRGRMRMQVDDGSSITYEGQYAQGLMEGVGVLQSDTRTVRGEFKANAFVKGTIETQDGRTFEVDTTASSIKEVMKDGSKRDLDEFPAELSVGA